MQILNPWERLRTGGLWSRVDHEHNRLIAAELTGRKHILDLGCGYGSLTRHLSAQGFHVHGIDADAKSVEQGRRLFPELSADTLRVMSAEQLEFPSATFDAVVMRDTLHHLYEEGDIDRIMSELERVLKDGARLVIFDPQPNLVVKICRKLVHHEDCECTAAQALALLRRRGWQIHKSRFTEAFALPLSGGYVAHPLVPSWPMLAKAIVSLNRVTSDILDAFHLGPIVLWRYLMVASFQRKAQATAISRSSRKAG